MAEIEAIDDYGLQLDVLKAFSQLLRSRFHMMLIYDHVVSHAANVLEAHTDPTSILYIGDLNYYTKYAETDLREALTGLKLHNFPMRDGPGSNM